MANLPKPNRRLGAPPKPEEASHNLQAPETAPAAGDIDRRSLRATGRTMQLATRVREDFHHELKVYAAQHKLKIVEVLEQAFDALKKERSSR